MKLTNSGAEDIVFKLKIRPLLQAKSYVSVYVSAYSSVVVSGIPVGSYEARFMSGEGWSSSANRFVRVSAVSRFAQPLDFQEREEVDRTVYSKYSLTLTPVLNGNARTETISEGSFADDLDE